MAPFARWHRRKAVGVYVPTDPYAPEERGGYGTVAFGLGQYFRKELRISCGPVNVKAGNPDRGRPADAPGRTNL